MVILLKIVILMIILAYISPFIIMAVVFIGGACVAPGTTRKEKTIAAILVTLGLLFIYIGFPSLVLLL